MKMLLRYAYDHDSIYPGYAFRYWYTVGDLQAHLRDMKSLWAANKDVIYAFQAGLLGMWGEWGRDGNGSLYGHESYPDALQAIMSAFFAAMPTDRKITFRHPYYKSWSIDQSQHPDWYARAGFDNDFFTLGTHPLAPGNDYPSSSDPHHQDCSQVAPPNDCSTWNQVVAESNDTVVDGEIPQNGDTLWNMNYALYGWETLQRLQAHRYSTFSLAQGNLSLDAWKREYYSLDQLNEMVTLLGMSTDAEYFGGGSRTAFELIRDFVGYRITLKQVTAPGTIVHDQGSIGMSITLENKGTAAPVNNRWIYPVLVDTATSSVCGASRGFPVNLTAAYPGTAATWSLPSDAVFSQAACGSSNKMMTLGLWMYDQGASPNNPNISRDARYSMRLDNASPMSWFAPATTQHPNGEWGINLTGITVSYVGN
jgi:hypothetical protein